MKVLMINTEKNRGGAAKMAATLVKAVDDHSIGIEARLVHCENDFIDKYTVGIKRPFSFYLNILQTRLFGTQSIFDFGVANQVLRMSRDADIVHIHNLHGYYINFVKLLNGLKKKPVIWTWHDMWGATGRCGVALNCEGWLNDCNPCEHKNYYPKVLLDFAGSEYNIKSKLYDSMTNLNIVTPSDWMMDIVNRRGITYNSIQVIPNPVDISQFRPLNKSQAKKLLNINDETAILFVAHNCNDFNKGYDDFSKIVDETGVMGIVVGVEPKKLNSNIKYLGKVASKQELAICYSAVEAFVITSKSDNYPNTVIEAMACGTPVFGYSVGGIPSQLNNKWGGLVDYGDYKSLSIKIKSFIESIENVDKLQSEISNYASKKWDASLIAKEYIELYKKVLS